MFRRQRDPQRRDSALALQFDPDSGRNLSDSTHPDYDPATDPELRESHSRSSWRAQETRPRPVEGRRTSSSAWAQLEGELAREGRCTRLMREELLARRGYVLRCMSWSRFGGEAGYMLSGARAGPRAGPAARWGCSGSAACVLPLSQPAVPPL